MTPFLDALRERVLVCDGAMGTMLYSRGVFINKSFDAMNLTQAPLVEAVHQEYVLAGAERFDRPLVMHRVRQRKINCIDIAIGQQGVV